MKDSTDKVTIDFIGENNMGKFKDLFIEMEEKFEQDFHISAKEPSVAHEQAAWEIENILSTFDINEIVALLSFDTKEKLFHCLLEYMDD